MEAWATASSTETQACRWEPVILRSPVAPRGLWPQGFTLLDVSLEQDSRVPCVHGEDKLGCP